MEQVIYDYRCRTVGEGIDKYCVADNWCVEFDVYDDIHPVICIRADRIRRNPERMALILRTIERENEEYPSCMVYPEKKTVAFKVERMNDLVKAME